MKLTNGIMILLIFSTLWIVGCSIKIEKETVGPEKEFPPSMTGMINVNGIDYQLEEGGYKWEKHQGFETQVVQTDHASPNQMAYDIKSILLKPNQKVDIKIEEDPDITVYLWNEKGREKEIKQESKKITVPSSKGKYIYEVLAKWTNGTVSYVFIVEVQ